ncbi:hypothetical protein BDV26DRAFT_4248 [Aspergillus bertholletiae]|uniref:Secreted protein n=1 Tax=Aspergillus bertholletiae TaxID=1226010 RepID=A0A5N7BKY7_9EURO|nr:hypothetical protein BDV26DRAFT_4248 [Aspergillus bertholletiae]
MKSGVFSILVLATSTVVLGRYGSAYNTSDIPEILITPPNDDRVGGHNIIRPHTSNVGQDKAVYGICKPREPKPACRAQIGKRSAVIKCHNKCTEGSCVLDSSQLDGEANCSVRKQV